MAGKADPCVGAVTPGFNWRRNLYIILIAQFISMAGTSTAIPFLPYYVESLGVTGAGQVEIWTGLLYTGQAISMAIMAPIWGSLADRIGRKVMVARAMLGGAVLLGAMGLAQNVQQMFILRTLQGAVTGTVTACNILVAAGTPSGSMAFALGLLEMGVFLGQSTGPTIGGLVADTLGYRACFWVTSGLMALGGMLVVLLVSEVHSDTTAGQQTSVREGLRLVLATPAVLSIFAIRLLVRSGFRITSPILALFVRDLVPGAARAASMVGLVTTAYTASSALSALVMGKLGDRLGVERVLLGSTALLAVAYGAHSGAQNLWQLGVLQALAGVAMGGILTTLNAAVARYAPKGYQGAVFGLNATIVALANAIGPLIGGGLAATSGNRVPFLAAGLSAGLAAALLYKQRAQHEAEKAVTA